MEIYFLRHAIAAEPGTLEVRSDAERPLTEEGIKKMKKAARGIRSMNLEFDEVISSPYLRARQTTDLVVDELGLEGKVRLSESIIPSANFEDFLKLIKNYSFDKKILVIGHEPSLSGFIASLISSGADASLEFKKSGMACVEVSDLDPAPRAQLKWLLTPQQLMALH